MTEAFVNSGWADKKLWAPPSAGQNEARKPGPGSPLQKGIKGISAGFGAGAERLAQEAKDDFLDDGPGAGGSEPSRPPKTRKSKMPKGPLEVLDPESSSSEESTDGSTLPAEYAVLDMTVPRTALVINVSHVLKRLNGCCSLNQLTKAIKHFKEKSGVTLEAFLRANPMSFKLEGRIVFLLERGEKWIPPPQQAAKGSDGKGGKGKGGKGGDKGGKSSSKDGDGHAKGRQAAHDDWWEADTGASAGKGSRKGKGGAAKGGASWQVEKGGPKGGASWEADGASWEAEKGGSAAGAGRARRKRGGGGGGGHDEDWGYDEDWGWAEEDWSSSAWGAADWKTNSWEIGATWSDSTWEQPRHRSGW